MKLTNLGRNSALKIRKEIITDLEDKGYKLPCGLIPMCEVVVNKFNINYLQAMVRTELEPKVGIFSSTDSQSLTNK